MLRYDKEIFDDWFIGVSELVELEQRVLDLITNGQKVYDRDGRLVGIDFSLEELLEIKEISDKCKIKSIKQAASFDLLFSLLDE